MSSLSIFHTITRLRVHGCKAESLTEFGLHLQILTETSEGLKTVHVKRNRVSDEENNLWLPVVKDKPGD